ncbi:8204_t:CDS:2 [Paraglomus brasilianum]|uniref:8204_t:CDS:1 n=1 Tax=Paraglomus brasilianum TaxID=144538 RepID=A0A9N8ZWR2_9GLOM|nr:8204_t:CDS:2 [Paraglomus brasilianum]
MFTQLQSGNVFSVLGIRWSPFNIRTGFCNILRRRYVVSNKRNNNILEEYRDDILKTYQIPGKYLKFIKKNRRQLKKEAYFTANYGSESIKRVSARKYRGEDVFKSKDHRQSESQRDLSPQQQNLINRVQRALVKSQLALPHAYLGSPFVKIVNVSVTPNLRTAQVWWKAESQGTVTTLDIEHKMREHVASLRNIVQQQIKVKKPPKIVFLRGDLAVGDIGKILDKLEAELKTLDANHPLDENSLLNKSPD